MKSKWIIIGICLIVAGLLLFVCAWAMGGWDLSLLSTAQYETNVHDLQEGFQNIRISTDTADITLLPSEDGKCRIICYEHSKAKHLTAVTDGTLSITVSNTRKWYDYISFFNFDTPKITVSLPADTYGNLVIDQSTGDTVLPADFSFENIHITASTGDVDCRSSVSEQIKIQASTGAIHLEALSASQVDLRVSTGSVSLLSVACEGDITLRLSTGKASLSDVTCRDLISEGDTGDLLLENVFSKGRFDLVRSTGDIRFDRCDATEIFVTTDTGDVTGSLLTGKLFSAQTDTGRIDIPETTHGGKCRITTDTGDIKITVTP